MGSGPVWFCQPVREVLRQIPWQLESQMAAKMEKREHLVLTFYNPKAPKIQGNRNYQRVRRYLIAGQMGGRRLTSRRA